MTIPKPLRVAVVGCGAVSQLYYTPALQKLESLKQLEVAALFDPNPTNLAQVHKVFPAATQVHDFDKLTRQGLDLAIIASPPEYHARQTIQLLKARLSVLCEKPMALFVAEAQAMVDAASASQGILAIGLFRRFFPAARTIHHILSQNILGKVRSFSCHEGRVFRWPIQSSSYFHQNGVLLDIGVHLLDLLIWWWGLPEQIIYEDDAMGGVEANCRIRLRFPQGFTGEVRLSRDIHLLNSYTIQCESGQIKWDVDETDKLQMGFLDSDYSLDAQLHKTSSKDQSLSVPADDLHKCFVKQLQNVISAFHGVEPLAIPAKEGLPSLRAIEYCYSHRSLMEMPWLSEQEAVRAQQLQGLQLR